MTVSPFITRERQQSFTPDAAAGTPDQPLYRRLLGDAFDRLPPVIRRMHTVSPRVVATGIGTVIHGHNLLSRILRRLLRLPAEGIERPLRVTFAARNDAEILSRAYPDAVLTTVQAPAGPAGSGLLREGFGPLSLILKLEPSSDDLSFRLLDVRCGRFSLPRWLRPRLQAQERTGGEWYHFSVRVDLPFIGRLIQYEGRLQIAPGAGEA